MADWLTDSPFLRDLGARWEDGHVAVDARRAQVFGDVLHGGAVAALAAVSARAAMRPDRPSSRLTTTSLHVDYVRAARGTAFTASTSIVRRTREFGFHQTAVLDAAGQVVAVAGGTLAEGRAGGGVLSPAAPLTGDPAEFDRVLGTMPFLADRGLRVEGVGRGGFEVGMAAVERNLDETGRIHEGAVLTLVDVAGTSVPWTIARPAPTGATVSLHARFFGALPEGPLGARARVRAHDERVHWSDVEVFDADRTALCALGSVVYRFG